MEMTLREHRYTFNPKKLKWKGDGPLLDMLNRRAEFLNERYGPQFGDKPLWMFNTTVEMYGGTDVSVSYVPPEDQSEEEEEEVIH